MSKEEEIKKRQEEQTRRQREEELRRIKEAEARQKALYDKTIKGRPADERPDKDD